ncbi:MAG: GNAT family N-acetyltransferase [Pelagerythrobacter marensis]|nr:MAG: GNAT family N-acetyltransferase [Pelagerythrobacter marensis]
MQGLIGPAAGSGPFARAEWFARLETREAGPLYACAGHREAVAILPLAQRGEVLHAMRNWYAFTWAPLGAADPELLTALAADLRRRSHQVVLDQLSEPVATGIRAAFADAGWRCEQQICDTNHYLRVEGRSFDAYLGGLAGQLRSTLRRKSGALTTEIVEHFTDDRWADYSVIYAESWKPVEGDIALLRDFARDEAAEGRLRLGLAHRRGADRYSPGTVLTAALMRHVIDQDRVAEVDFGTGDDAYKRIWMERSRPRYRLDCLDARQAIAWPALTRRIARNLARRGPRS